VENVRGKSLPADAELFSDLRDAKSLAAGWKNAYTRRRPHSSPGRQAPALYAGRLAGPAVRVRVAAARQAEKPVGALTRIAPGT